ncbi:hypothetical protein C5615_03765 [Burkholderia cepacia]|uniref:Uncharacterized protein n=1 Tax=Burkholderia cepacia TaxID=292 RepID=A0A2S8J382_BURCE|nr:hypothetical protein C5615_03765 [Burkholderia cepacia]TDA44951.1 hypothetical protein EVG18_23880 [Burkholderia pyrrocinia]
MPGATAQVGHVLIDIHRVTREASRAGRHEFVGKRGAAIRGWAIRMVRRPKGRAADGRPGFRSIVSGLCSAR